MKTFLSWSGDQSKAYANALRDWLPLVLHFVEPWVSDADIEAGERWASEVGKELESSNFGIICIDRENVGSQWLLFEAGALSRSMQEGRVIPLLFDIEFKDISGPLAQFQAKKFEGKGVWDVVCAINKLGETPIPDLHLKRLFDALWPDLEKAVEAIPKSAKTTKSRPQHEVLEELVSSVRGLDIRLREVAEGSGESRIKKSRISRSINRDMMSIMSVEPGSPIRLMMMASLLKEDLPWLYDIAAEVYRFENSGNKIRASQARRQLIEAIRTLPLTRYIDDKFTYEIFHEMEYLIRREEGIVSSSSKKTDPSKSSAQEK